MRIFLLCALVLMPFFAQRLQSCYVFQKDLITSRDLFPQAPYFVIDSFSDRFDLEIPSQTLEKLFQENKFFLEKSPHEKIKFHFTSRFDTKKAQEQIKQAFFEFFRPFNPKITEINLKPLTEIKGKEIEILGAKIQDKAFKKKKFSLIVETLVDGEKRLIPFLCEIDADLEVLIAREGIKAGQDLSDENITKKRIAFEAFSVLPALSEQAYTSSSRSFIAKGSVIFVSKLKPQMIVKRGDWIEVLLQEGNIMIQARLQAMQNASLGQEINAKNPQSQKIIRVRITDKGRGIAL